MFLLCEIYPAWNLSFKSGVTTRKYQSKRMHLWDCVRNCVKVLLEFCLFDTQIGVRSLDLISIFFFHLSQEYISINYVFQIWQYASHLSPTCFCWCMPSCALFVLNFTIISPHALVSRHSSEKWLSSLFFKIQCLSSLWYLYQKFPHVPLKP